MNDIDFQIVDVENELEKRRNHRQPEIIPTAARSKMSFGKMLFFFLLGLVLFRVCGELLRFIFQ